MLIVWLSFEVEGETFEVQFPTNATDEHWAFMQARDDLRWKLQQIADKCTATHFEREDNDV